MAEINVSISGQLWNLGLTYVPQCEPGPRIEVWHLEHWGGAVFLNEQFLTHFCNDNSSLRPIPMDTNNLYVNERRFILQGKHWGRLQFWSLQTTGFYPLQNSWCKTASLPARLLLSAQMQDATFFSEHASKTCNPSIQCSEQMHHRSRQYLQEAPVCLWCQERPAPPDGPWALGVLGSLELQLSHWVLEHLLDPVLLFFLAIIKKNNAALKV